MNQLFNMDMINRFNQFKKTISGNPQQQVQQLMNSGKISQAQYNEAVQKANELYKMIFGN